MKKSLSFVELIGFAFAFHQPGSIRLFSVSFEISWYKVERPKVVWNLGTHGHVLVSYGLNRLLYLYPFKLNRS